MKKVFLYILLTLLPILASAETVEIDGINYNLITKGQVAEVTNKQGGYSGDVVIPKTVTYNGVEYTVTTLGAGISLFLDKLNSISIPPTVNLIKDGALFTFNEIIIYITDLEAWFNINFDCPEYPPFSSFRLFLNGIEINNLTIPQIKQINNYIFRGCSSLNSVTIPSCVEVIGENSFAGCTNLTSLTISNGVSKIGNGAFWGCTGLTSVNMPNSVTSVGSSAFKNCTGLESINLSSSMATIGGSAFEGCYSLTSMTIPNGVTHIDSYTFNGCSGLTSVTIPGSVTSIGEYAFMGCKGLKSITIPNSVTSINSSAFDGCSGLTSVSIPNNVKYLGNCSFRMCSSLTSIIIGSNVDWIQSLAFSFCSELKDVYCYSNNVLGNDHGDHDRTDSNAFESSYIEYATLHVPLDFIDAFRSEKPWKDFGTIVSLEEDDVPEIKKCATPEINYANGKVYLSCETEGVEFISEVKVDDAKKYYDSEFNLSQTYKITVYATKDGYENSDVTTREIVIENGLPSLFGDLNKDGKVNVADHVKLSDIIMNK